jgi:hypothetical protein
MLMATVYRWRDDAHGKETVRAVMERYMEVGNDPGMVAHYVFSDGTGGIVINEVADANQAYRTSLRMSEFLDLQASFSTPVLVLDDALAHVGELLGS